MKTTIYIQFFGLFGFISRVLVVKEFTSKHSVWRDQWKGRWTTIIMESWTQWELYVHCIVQQGILTARTRWKDRNIPVSDLTLTNIIYPQTHVGLPSTLSCIPLSLNSPSLAPHSHSRRCCEVAPKSIVQYLGDFA